MINLGPGMSEDEPNPYREETVVSPAESIVQMYAEKIGAPRDLVEEGIFDILENIDLNNTSASDDVLQFLQERDLEVRDLILSLGLYLNIYDFIEKLEALSLKGDVNAGPAFAFMLNSFMVKFSIPEGEFENTADKMRNLKKILEDSMFE